MKRPKLLIHEEQILRFTCSVSETRYSTDVVIVTSSSSNACPNHHLNLAFGYELREENPTKCFAIYEVCNLYVICVVAICLREGCNFSKC